jgi:hypothetical protein
VPVPLLTLVLFAVIIAPRAASAEDDGPVALAAAAAELRMTAS